MTGFPTREEVEKMKKTYREGDRIKLIAMNDPFSKLMPGTLGTVDHVDDIGTVHVKWDTGEYLGVCYGEDSFALI